MYTKKIGYVLIISSLILLGAMFFIKADSDKQATYLCELTAADPSLDMENCPAHQSNLSWFITFAFVIAFLVLVAGIYLLTLKDEKKPKKVDTSKLDKQEKSIYDVLKKHDSIYQSDLIKETGFSKVKITRILDKLESKNLIERKRRGMTNVIFLR